MSRTLQPDDRISHYRVIGPLGAGGMGEVYIAQDSSLERSVALKILPPHLVRNEERVRRFITEAKSASSLNHPNIVTIYEIGHDTVRPGGTGGSGASSPVHFISMELVTGDTLSRRIHEEREDLRTLVGYIAQAAEGVAKAHAAGIVHRDLKPGNIMVSKDGFAKVLDFGLAKLTERQAAPEGPMTSAPTEGAHTGEGVVMGTVGYMSPEQVQAKAADHRSDIFSMGCILYEAATRKRPFVADTDVEVMHQILRDKPRPVEELNPDVPAEVRKLIRRCLAKSPDQRFQSMKDLAMDLREVVEEWDSLPATATSAGSLTSGALAAPPARHTRLAAAIAAGAILGLGGLALGLYLSMGGRASKPPAASPSQQMKISTLMSRNDLDEAVLSGDGRYLAFVTSAGDRSSLNVRQVRTGSDAQILAPQEFQIRGISFSPDGDYLYFLNHDPDLPNYQALFKVASLGGTPRKIAFDVDTAVTFSPDGKRLCFRRGVVNENADSLVIVEPETGEERELIRVKEPESFASPASRGTPSWSPDGERIAVPIFDATGGARTRIATIDVESGARANVGSQAWLFIDSVAWLPDGSAIILSAAIIGSSADQIYSLPYPEGEVRRLTSDLDGYRGLSLSSDGRTIAATRNTNIKNIWVAPLEPGSEAQPVTFASGSAASVVDIEPLSDGGVAFTAPQGERLFLWRMAPDGSNRRQLASEGLAVLGMEFAEGAGIVFTQVDENAVVHTWRIDPDGGRLRQVTDGSGEMLEALAPDGKTVLFVRVDDFTKVWSVDLAGREQRLFLSFVAAGGSLFAPDGGKLLYQTFEEVEGRVYPKHVVIPAAGGEPLATFLLPPGADHVRWAPDGQAVTYVDRATGFNLMRRSIAKDDTTQLTHFEAGRLIGHEWSPDGKRALLHRRLGQQDSLWILEPGAGKPPTLLTGFKTGEIYGFAWARDSKSIVFTYGTSSQDVVLISEFD